MGFKSKNIFDLHVYQSYSYMFIFKQGIYMCMVHIT